MEMPCVMNAIDNMLSGDEPEVEVVKDMFGLRAAEHYVDEYNNACVQMAGFEDFLQGMQETSHVFYAPPTNVSYSQDH